MDEAPARLEDRVSPGDPVSPGGSSSPAIRADAGYLQSLLPDEFAWMGAGLLPSDDEIRRATEVLCAVPLAAAAGWSVRGNPWSCHPRRLRTAVIPPRADWDITCMRGVREVDSLSGRMIVRRRHLRRVSSDGPVVEEGPNPLVRAMRADGFRLLLLGRPEAI